MSFDSICREERREASAEGGHARNRVVWSLYAFRASIRGEALSGEFQMRIIPCFWGLNRCFAQQPVKSGIFVSTPGMMHMRIMGLSQSTNAEGANHISLGRRPRR
jgi:hypothetical protein